MAHLIDTSVLARLANTVDPFHAIAAHAVLELHRRGEELGVTPQNLVEFGNMATRPKLMNGLGLSAVDAEAKAAVFEATFFLSFAMSQKANGVFGQCLLEHPLKSIVIGVFLK